MLLRFILVLILWKILHEILIWYKDMKSFKKEPPYLDLNLPEKQIVNFTHHRTRNSTFTSNRVAKRGEAESKGLARFSRQVPILCWEYSGRRDEQCFQICWYGGLKHIHWTRARRVSNVALLKLLFRDPDLFSEWWQYNVLNGNLEMIGSVSDAVFGSNYELIEFVTFIVSVESRFWHRAIGCECWTRILISEDPPTRKAFESILLNMPSPSLTDQIVEFEANVVEKVTMGEAINGIWKAIRVW